MKPYEQYAIDCAERIADLIREAQECGSADTASLTAKVIAAECMVAACQAYHEGVKHGGDNMADALMKARVAA